MVLAKYVDELPLPPVATPLEGQAGGEASYRIRHAQTSQQLHRDLPDTTV